MFHIPRRIKKVLIVYKKSSYQTHALEARDRNYLRLLREGNVAIRRSRRTHDRHLETLERVKRGLKKVGIPFDVRLRYHLIPIRGYDLVVTVGGDGTLLETAHSMERGLLLGINSVPFESVGFFCRTDGKGFAKKIGALLRGKAPIRELNRLKIRIDGKRALPPVLNDVLFANQNPAGTTRYLLKVGRRVEEQKSSGLWVSPASGSTAATRSAGGRCLPLVSRNFQYLVREPYTPPEEGIRRYRLVKGVLGPRTSLTIISMMGEGALYLDGPHESVPIHRGGRIVIRNTHRPLSVVW